MDEVHLYDYEFIKMHFKYNSISEEEISKQKNYNDSLTQIIKIYEQLIDLNILIIENNGRIDKIENFFRFLAIISIVLFYISFILHFFL